MSFILSFGINSFQSLLSLVCITTVLALKKRRCQINLHFKQRAHLLEKHNLVTRHKWQDLYHNQKLFMHNAGGGQLIQNESTGAPLLWRYY